MKRQPGKSDEESSTYSSYILDQDLKKDYAATARLPSMQIERGLDGYAGHAAVLTTADYAELCPKAKIIEFTTIAGDRVPICLPLFIKGANQPGSSVISTRGGALIAGSVANLHSLIARHVKGTNVPFLTVAYRKVPDQASGTNAAKSIAFDPQSITQVLPSRE